MKIEKITAREILDSRGNPTVAATVYLSDGVTAEASVPSGASTGANESFELHDNDSKRYAGQGELKAVHNIEKIISPALTGHDAKDQVKIDKILCNLDGTKNKQNLGANAILAVSLAVARAEAISDELELYEYLSVKYRGSFGKKYMIPTPMFNVLNGGKHAANNVDVQETMIVPLGLKNFAEKLRAGAEIYHSIKNILTSAGLETGLGDEGGFAPELKKNEDVFGIISKAISETGYSKSKVRLSVDIAATSLYQKKSNTYLLAAEKKHLSVAEFIALLNKWVKKYNLFSVEDGLSENDIDWPLLTAKIKPARSIGDDLFTTNAAKISDGLKNKSANGVIIKPNQIGTLSETFKAIKTAQKNGALVVISHRSGETEDSFIADLAVAVGAEFIKSGAPARSERLAKYNRLLKIEELLTNK